MKAEAFQRHVNKAQENIILEKKKRGGGKKNEEFPMWFWNWLLNDVSVKAKLYQTWKRDIIKALQVNGKHLHFCYPYLRIYGKSEQSEIGMSKIRVPESTQIQMRALGPNIDLGSWDWHFFCKMALCVCV